MYDKFALGLKKGVETTAINYLTGVHQGENLAPFSLSSYFK